MRVTSITVGLMLVMTIPALADDKKPTEAEMQEMMKTYQELATPGEPHKRLTSLAGRWATTTKSWMDPDAPPMESTGSCEATTLLEGRYVQQTCTGQMMGHPFTGIGTTGYDNYMKKYVSTWMDTMGTGIFLMTGTANADGRTIILHGGHDDPFEGRMEHRAVWTIPDKDHQTFELYGTGKQGHEMKMMEIRYTRKP